MNPKNCPEYLAYSEALKAYESAHHHLWQMDTIQNSETYMDALHAYLDARANWLAVAREQREVVL